MPSFAEFLIAFRYIKTKRQDKLIAASSLFSFLGVCLGVAALIVVLAVMKGFHIELQDRMLGTNGHVTIKAKNNTISNYEDYELLLSNYEFIENIFPTIESEVLISNQGSNHGGFLRGIREDDLFAKQIISDNLQKISDNNISNDDYVYIGLDMARNLQVEVGDKLTIISPQSSMTVLGLIPRHKTYSIAGIYQTGIYQYDFLTLFMPLATAQTFLNMTDKISKFEIFVDDIDATSNYMQVLARNLPNEFMLYDWKYANPLFNALEVERTVMVTILTLVILVAAFNIISSLIMLVHEKAHDIAILRTIGVTKAGLLRIFLIVGCAIGIIGTIFGAILGIMIAKNLNTIKKLLQNFTGTELFDPVIYYLTQLPSKIIMSDVLLICLLSVTLTILASLYPARRAANSDPVELLAK